jgi:hypothetical protein
MSKLHIVVTLAACGFSSMVGAWFAQSKTARAPETVVAAGAVSSAWPEGNNGVPLSAVDLSVILWYGSFTSCANCQAGQPCFTAPFTVGDQTEKVIIRNGTTDEYKCE